MNVADLLAAWSGSEQSHSQRSNKNLGQKQRKIRLNFWQSEGSLIVCFVAYDESVTEMLALLWRRPRRIYESEACFGRVGIKRVYIL